jgi:ribonuclease HI
MEVLDDNALNIYTDGSSLSHPRRGGIGYRFVTVGEDGHEVTLDSAHPGYEEGTNQ